MQIIDELQKLEAAATVAPWVIEIDDEGFDGAAIYSNDGGWGTAYVCKDMEQIDGGLTDAELIVAMRNNLPKLIAALWRVAARHQPELVLWAPKEPKLLCAECRTTYPCNTRQEMDKELEGE